jgi:hypothetical protein
LSYVTNSNTIPLGSIAKFMLDILMEGQKFCGHAQKTFHSATKRCYDSESGFHFHSKVKVQAKLAYPLPSPKSALLLQEQNILAGGAINKLLEDKN